MRIKEVSTIVVSTEHDDFVVGDMTIVEVKAWKAWADIMARENKVVAIKRIRQELHCGLREAKNFVEEAQTGPYGYFDTDGEPF